MEDKLTSFGLSKKLHEAGCKLKPSAIYIDNQLYVLIGNYYVNSDGDTHDVYYKDVVRLPEHIFAYDLLWDVCVKYAEEFWGEDCMMWRADKTELFHTILSLLQQNKKQDAEDYIIKHSLFFKEEK